MEVFAVKIVGDQDIYMITVMRRPRLLELQKYNKKELGDIPFKKVENPQQHYKNQHLQKFC